jgi:hypothetical protein
MLNELMIAAKSATRILACTSLVIACNPPKAPPDSTYQGYRIGMRADSALMLAKADAGEAANCYSSGSTASPEYFCAAGSLHPGMRSLVYLVHQDAQLIGLDLAKAMDTVSVATIRREITRAWGDPDSTTLPAPSHRIDGAQSRVIGHWTRSNTWGLVMVNDIEGFKWMTVNLKPLDRVLRDARRDTQGAQRFRP